MIEQLDHKRHAPAQLPKTLTGIQGLDEITEGGLPQGRPTLLVGGAGCGKTLLAMEFLVNGARHFQEPGASLGFDLPDLIDRRLLLLDYVYLERSDIEVASEFDLEGLFIRLGHAIDSLGARRVVLDTIEAIFSALPNEAILRAELRRLFRWLKSKGVTAVITCERGNATLTRYGLEEYVADCVILLEHRVTEQLSIRRLRIAKYRGSRHSSNEFPFLLEADGLTLLPITSLGLTHQGVHRACLERRGAAGYDAHRGLLPRQYCPALRHEWHRQDVAAGPLCGRVLRTRRTLPVYDV
jgi:circadian clock protein KaiC